ncbi:hypothetical protein HDU98_000032 [Podochytrium sp. JEL0797]|nr:hypothetical protein HDU98_000032 [Podochytrium sp. JEL0797]
MKVVIIGAGLVGAATALGLRQQGHECTLYDQINLAEAIKKANGGNIEAIDFGETGGSVSLGASAQRVLKQLGVLAEVLKSAERSPLIQWFKMDGSSAVSLEAAKVAAFCGAEDPEVQCTVQIMRSKLHDILVKAAYKAGVHTFVGKKLVSVSQTETDVTAKFADGTSAAGDLLIGADGIHSATRRKVLGDELKAQYTGVIGYIGIVNLAEHDIHMDTNCAFFIDREKRQLICTFKVADQTAAINVFVINESDPGESRDDAYRPYADLPKHAERLADLIQGWGAPDNLVMMMRKAHRIIPTSIYDLPDLTRYHDGRVLLIGDAAHGMVPNAGLGCGTGLEDVVTLVELVTQLPDPVDLPRVLTLYSAIRVPHATGKAQKSRELAESSYKVSVLGAGFSHFVLRVGIFAFNHNLMKYAEFFDVKAEVAKAIEVDSK